MNVRTAEPRVERATTTVASQMIQYLEAAGVRHLFGYPGTPNIELLEMARRAGFELILGRREGTAGFMAEAYGMLTGRPGVCISTLGPGSTALVNPVASAYLDRVPMLAISGQAEFGLEPFFTHQVVDHGRLYASITKWATRMQPECSRAILRKALRIAMADRPGPVHITTNANVLTAPAEAGDVALPPLAAEPGAPQLFAAAGADLDPLRILERARRPVVLAGISALRADATPALTRFVERVGCPVVVTPMAKGVFREDHPYFASTLDMACNDVVWDLLTGSDLILAVGFDAVELVKPWKLTVPTVHIDSTPNTDQIYAAQLEVVGGIAGILDALREGYRGEARWEEREVAEHRAQLLRAYYAGRVAGRLNPSEVVDSIKGAFPRETIVTTDVGSHKLLVAQGWQATVPRSFLNSNGLSSMGFGLPAAITAKLLNPDRPVVAAIGDGGFAMVQGELQLASELGLDIVVVVFCDDSLNRIEIKQQLKGYPSVMTRIAPTDLVRLAESMGCEGAEARDVAELERALDRRSSGRGTPLVVAARIDPTQYDSQF